MTGIGKTIAEAVMVALAFVGIIQALGRGWEGWSGSESSSDGDDGGGSHHGE